MAVIFAIGTTSYYQVNFRGEIVRLSLSKPALSEPMGLPSAISPQAPFGRLRASG